MLCAFSVPRPWSCSSLPVALGENITVAKYDGRNAGSEVWYVGGQTGVIDIPAEGLLGQNYGLSGWTLFGGTPGTPDGGMTVALLGLGLAGLAGLRARFGS